MKVDIFNTDKKYNIIYADPPWAFKNWSAKGAKNVSEHYNTMSTKDIGEFPIESISNNNSVLLMWATFPCLKEALKLVELWGFKYKTVAFTWIKTNKKNKNTLFWGMGYYTRSNAEICILATKGKPLNRISHKVHSVVQSPIEEHSKKPSEVRERIIQLFGDLPRIELFARQEVDGWDCWGNEV